MRIVKVKLEFLLKTVQTTFMKLYLSFLLKLNCSFINYNNFYFTAQIVITYGNCLEVGGFLSGNNVRGVGTASIAVKN